MDNGTMVEAFKYLNYSQLAKNSFVSKSFWDLIRTNRCRLALLYVNHISMGSCVSVERTVIEIFGQKLSPEAYNEWAIGNNYSKQIPMEGQVARMQSTENEWRRTIYDFRAGALYKDPKYGRGNDISTAFSAKAELNHENWPLFQHFVRLLMDPFIYIHCMGWVPEKEVLSLLSEAICPDRSRLHCEQLVFNHRGNVENPMSWIKDHVLCTEFLYIDAYCPENCDAELLDFFMTGANCASEIIVKHYDLSKVLVDFIKKFKDLKSCDEYNVVQFIECKSAEKLLVEEFKREHAEFVLKEEIENGIATHTFEFANNEIGKILKLNVITQLDFFLNVNFFCVWNMRKEDTVFYSTFTCSLLNKM
ncbi:hypothetical protein DdX_15723 [Ditylenchus destructor]|uniref:Uncharacterized protein n=1 Tax=Ditylenchus destructor TaxID=166010 RepID=A0AAD4MPS7_9BILA|nr:hypothetical protein DdX_15723 [Ditylenchus destructor]